MLEVTQQAAEVIREIVEAEEAPEGAGLRIEAGETSEDGTDLSLTFVAQPEPGDDAVEHEGAHVYLSAEASALLDDKVLHAHQHGDHVHFDIGQQGEELPEHEHDH